MSQTVDELEAEMQTLLKDISIPTDDELKAAKKEYELTKSDEEEVDAMCEVDTGAAHGRRVRDEQTDYAGKGPRTKKSRVDLKAAESVQNNATPAVASASAAGDITVPATIPPILVDDQKKKKKKKSAKRTDPDPDDDDEGDTDTKDVKSVASSKADELKAKMNASAAAASVAQAVAGVADSKTVSEGTVVSTELKPKSSKADKAAASVAADASLNPPVVKPAIPPPIMVPPTPPRISSAAPSPSVSNTTVTPVAAVSPYPRPGVTPTLPASVIGSAGGAAPMRSDGDSKPPSISVAPVPNRSPVVAVAAKSPTSQPIAVPRPSPPAPVVASAVAAPPASPVDIPARIKELTGQLAVAQVEIDRLSKENKQYSATNVERNGRFIEEQKSLVKAQNEVAELTVKITQLTAANQTLQTESVDKMRSVVEQQKNADAVIINRLRDEIAETKEQSNVGALGKEPMLAQIKDLTEQLSAAQTQIAALESTVVQKDTKYGELNQAYISASSTRDEIQKQAIIYYNEKAQLEIAIATLNAKLAETGQLVEQKTKLLEEQKAEIGQMINANRDLKALSDIKIAEATDATKKAEAELGKARNDLRVLESERVLSAATLQTDELKAAADQLAQARELATRFEKENEQLRNAVAARPSESESGQRKQKKPRPASSSNNGGSPDNKHSDPPVGSGGAPGGSSGSASVVDGKSSGNGAAGDARPVGDEKGSGGSGGGDGDRPARDDSDSDSDSDYDPDEDEPSDDEDEADGQTTASLRRIITRLLQLLNTERQCSRAIYNKITEMTENLARGIGSDIPNALSMFDITVRDALIQMTQLITTAVTSQHNSLVAVATVPYVEVDMEQNRRYIMTLNADKKWDVKMKERESNVSRLGLTPDEYDEFQRRLAVDLGRVRVAYAEIRADDILNNDQINTSDILLRKTVEFKAQLKREQDSKRAEIKRLEESHKVEVKTLTEDLKRARADSKDDQTALQLERMRKQESKFTHQLSKLTYALKREKDALKSARNDNKDNVSATQIQRIVQLENKYALRLAEAKRELKQQRDILKGVLGNAKISANAAQLERLANQKAVYEHKMAELKRLQDAKNVVHSSKLSELKQQLAVKKVDEKLEDRKARLEADSRLQVKITKLTEELKIERKRNKEEEHASVIEKRAEIVDKYQRRIDDMDHELKMLRLQQANEKDNARNRDFATREAERSKFKTEIDRLKRELTDAKQSEKQHQSSQLAATKQKLLATESHVVDLFNQQRDFLQQLDTAVDFLRKTREMLSRDFDAGDYQTISRMYAQLSVDLEVQLETFRTSFKSVTDQKRVAQKSSIEIVREYKTKLGAVESKLAKLAQDRKAELNNPAINAKIIKLTNQVDASRLMLQRLYILVFTRQKIEALSRSRLQPLQATSAGAAAAAAAAAGVDAAVNPNLDSKYATVVLRTPPKDAIAPGVQEGKRVAHADMGDAEMKAFKLEIHEKGWEDVERLFMQLLGDLDLDRDPIIRDSTNKILIDQYNTLTDFFDKVNTRLDDFETRVRKSTSSPQFVEGMQRLYAYNNDSDGVYKIQEDLKDSIQKMVDGANGAAADPKFKVLSKPEITELKDIRAYAARQIAEAKANLTVAQTSARIQIQSLTQDVKRLKSEVGGGGGIGRGKKTLTLTDDQDVTHYIPGNGKPFDILYRFCVLAAGEAATSITSFIKKNVLTSAQKGFLHTREAGAIVGASKLEDDGEGGIDITLGHRVNRELSQKSNSEIPTGVWRVQPDGDHTWVQEQGDPIGEADRPPKPERKAPSDTAAAVAVAAASITATDANGNIGRFVAIEDTPADLQSNLNKQILYFEGNLSDYMTPTALMSTMYCYNLLRSSPIYAGAPLLSMMASKAIYAQFAAMVGNAYLFRSSERMGRDATKPEYRAQAASDRIKQAQDFLLKKIRRTQVILRVDQPVRTEGSDTPIPGYYVEQWENTYHATALQRL